MVSILTNFLVRDMMAVLQWLEKRMAFKPKFEVFTRKLLLFIVPHTGSIWLSMISIPLHQSAISLVPLNQSSLFSVKFQKEGQWFQIFLSCLKHAGLANIRALEYSLKNLKTFTLSWKHFQQRELELGARLHISYCVLLARLFLILSDYDILLFSTS